MSAAPFKPLSETEAEIYVRAAYIALLDREPDASGLRGKASFLARSGSLDAVVNEITESVEFAEKSKVNPVLAERQRMLARPWNVDWKAIKKGYYRGGSPLERWLRRLSWRFTSPLLRSGLAAHERAAQKANLLSYWGILDFERSIFRDLTAGQGALAQRLMVVEEREAMNSGRLSKEQMALAYRLRGIEERDNNEVMALQNEAHKLKSEQEQLVQRLLAFDQRITDVERHCHDHLVHRLIALEETIKSGEAEKPNLNLSIAPHGIFLVFARDLVGDKIARGEFWDPHLEPIIKSAGDRSKSAIDAGAYIGFHSVVLGKYFREVHSFEPQLRCFRILNANILLNGLRNVRAYNKPLYDVQLPMGLAPLELQDIPIPIIDDEIDYSRLENAGAVAFAPSSRSRMEAVTIDSLGLTDVGFIKIDTQGCDLRVLRGARATIAASRPVIAFEFEEKLSKMHGSDLSDYRLFFEECNYNMKESAHNSVKQWDYIATPK